MRQHNWPPLRLFRSPFTVHVFFCLLIASSLVLQPPRAGATSVTDYINMVLPWAQQAHALYGVPVSVAIAQSAHESGWNLPKANNNFFNILYLNPNVYTNDPYTTGATNGGWRAYNSGSDAFLGYGYFVTHDPNFTGSGGAKIDCRPDLGNALQFLHDIAFDGFDGGYNAPASVKQGYYDAIKEIMDENNLTQYDVSNGPSTDIYVDGGYSGTQSGTASNPYNTLAAAVNVASTTAAVTIHIRPGTYHEKLTIHKNIHFVTNGSGTVRIGA